jgi:hypothetical protein
MFLGVRLRSDEHPAPANPGVTELRVDRVSKTLRLGRCRAAESRVRTYLDLGPAVAAGRIEVLGDAPVPGKAKVGQKFARSVTIQRTKKAPFPGPFQ